MSKMPKRGLKKKNQIFNFKYLREKDYKINW